MPIFSTEILLRSRDKGLALSDRLGANFSGNGDALGFAYDSYLKAEKDEEGTLTAHFGIRHTPALVEQSGDVLLVTEHSISRKGKAS